MCTVQKIMQLSILCNTISPAINQKYIHERKTLYFFTLVHRELFNMTIDLLSARIAQRSLIILLKL